MHTHTITCSVSSKCDKDACLKALVVHVQHRAKQIWKKNKNRHISCLLEDLCKCFQKLMKMQKKLKEKLKEISKQ